MPHNYALHSGQKIEDFGKIINSTVITFLYCYWNNQTHQYHLSAISSHRINHRNMLLLLLVAGTMAPQNHTHQKNYSTHRHLFWQPQTVLVDSKMCSNSLNCNYFSEMVDNILAFSSFWNIIFSLAKSPLLNCVYDNTIGVWVVQALADSWYSGDRQNKFAEAHILLICLKNIVQH